MPDLATPPRLIESRVATTDHYYLPMFDIPMLQGRNFTAQKVATQTLVVIINQAFGQKLNPDGHVVDKSPY